MTTVPFATATLEVDPVLDEAAVLLPAPSGDGSSLRLFASCGIELDDEEAPRFDRELLALPVIRASSKSLMSSCFRLDVADATLALGDAAEPTGLGDCVGVADGRGGGGVCEE